MYPHMWNWMVTIHLPPAYQAGTLPLSYSSMLTLRVTIPLPRCYEHLALPIELRVNGIGGEVVRCITHLKSLHYTLRFQNPPSQYLLAVSGGFEPQYLLRDREIC